MGNFGPRSVAGARSAKKGGFGKPNGSVASALGARECHRELSTALCKEFTSGTAFASLARSLGEEQSRKCVNEEEQRWHRVRQVVERPI